MHTVTNVSHDPPDITLTSRTSSLTASLPMTGGALQPLCASNSSKILTTITSVEVIFSESPSDSSTTGFSNGSGAGVLSVASAGAPLASLTLVTDCFAAGLMMRSSNIWTVWFALALPSESIKSQRYLEYFSQIAKGKKQRITCLRTREFFNQLGRHIET